MTGKQLETKSDSVALSSTQGAVKARRTIHGSDRRIEINHHDGDVLSFHIFFGDALSLQFAMTAQELANTLDVMDVKLPKPSKNAGAASSE